jgi:hypothetical protein
MSDLKENHSLETHKHTDAFTTQLLTMYQELQKEVTSNIRAETELFSELKASILRIEQKTDAILSGFPNESPKEHREYHEAVMEKMQASAMFWKKMLFEITKYGLIGAIFWSLYYLWKAFLLGPR